MPALPTGRVTFFFTDIEGSTRLWERHPQGMQAALARHDAILRHAIEAHGGTVFKTVGDAFCAAFALAPAALAAALDAQRALQAEPWSATGLPPERPLRVRMALHADTAEASNGDYFGLALSRIARLLSAGHGGQILLSQAAVDQIHDSLSTGVTLQDLGAHHLKDLSRPERIFQIVAPELPAEFPPLRTLDTHPNNLPAQPTSLVGREEEVAAVRLLLRQPDVRLVTLIGPGGTGKTRLSLQAAADLLHTFEDGVFFVALSPVGESALVTSTIAHALGMKELPGVAATGRAPLLETLKEHLRDKHLLLVLDNFEQVTEAAPVIAELLTAAPQLKAIVTSRSVLHISGEHVFPVPPLALPPPATTAAEIARYASVELFVQRARAVAPNFRLTDANAPAVAGICARLDGLPLAIELAAARVKLLPPQALLSRLDSRLKTLTIGARDLPRRQQTLRAAFDWGHELLTPEEQMIFRRLGVFANGCTLEAAEAVCGDQGSGIRDQGSDELFPAPDPRPMIPVFEGLAALVDKSLVQQIETAGEPRFTMLETIREYALDRLEAAAEAAVAHHRHALYYLALAEQAEPELYGADQRSWLARLDAEYDNLRAALAWSLQQAAPLHPSSFILHPSEVGLRLAGALWVFWYKRGMLSEGRAWLMNALTMAEASQLPVWRSKALHGAGSLALYQNDFAAATALLEESLALYRQLGNGRGNAWVISNLGQVAFYQGDDDRAASLYSESLAISRDLGDTFNAAWALNHLGRIAIHQRDSGRTWALLAESLALFRSLDHTAGAATVLGNMARAARAQGDDQRARALFTESFNLFRDLGQKTSMALCLVGLAAVAAESAQPELAARLLGAAEGMCDSVAALLSPLERAGHERMIAAVRASLGSAGFAAIYGAGREMSLDRLLAEVLGE